MKKILSILMAGSLLLLFSCQGGQKKTGEAKDSEKSAEVAGPNQLTKAETDAGWVLLFDGTTSKGWRGVNKDHFPTNWEITDGTLHCKASGKGEAGAEDGGDILYEKEFKNFRLQLEWKIAKGGNSGIFYLGKEGDNRPIWQTAPEMQVLDNENHPDARAGKDGNRMAGSLYDLIPAKPQNAKPAGEWNSIEIEVYNGSVWHRQNNETVLEYHLWTEEWNKLVAGSKFPEYNPNWAKVANQGVIALQDHGDDVWYRNIKIKVTD